MLAEVDLFGATTLLAQLLVALGLIVLLSILGGRAMDVFEHWRLPPISETKDDSDAR